MASGREAERFDSDACMKAFDSLTDPVAILEVDGNIAYANPYFRQLLGWELAAVVGRSLADYLYPEDLDRALQVMARIGDGTPVTPAEFRFLRSDGSWCPIEVNATAFVPGQTSPTLVIGRYSGDHDIQDRILRLLTAGRSIEAAIDLVPEFGSWRHPHDHYTVLTQDAGGGWRVAGSPAVMALTGIDRRSNPWDVAARSGRDQRVLVDHMPATLAAAARSIGLIECWAVPVPDPRHREPAVVIAWTRAGGFDTEIHHYSLQMMARSLNLILLWGQKLADLEWAARHDSLTGAANRSYFFSRLEAVGTRAGSTVGVLYADLDGFKAVNDAHGHSVGDAVLRAVAARFTAAIAEDHVLARLGGDEFAVLCPDLVDASEATRTAAAMVASMRHPVAVGDLMLPVGVSVGVATASCDGTVRPDPLVEKADRALYAAKSSGRGRWVLA